MQKQLQLFLIQEDEIRLSECLRAEISSLQFLNDNIWENYPDFRTTIEDCDTGRVYLYAGNPEDLPTCRRENGDLEGPIAGRVIQILRTIRRGEVLLSGRVAAGVADNDEHMRAVVQKVWKCIRSVGKVGVVRPDGRIDRNYLVGHHTRRLLAETNVKIADRSIGMSYEPVA